MTIQQTQSLEIGALASALSKAQSVMEGAKEDSNNPFFHSKYADLASVWAACKVPLTSNGLSVVQTVENGGEKAYLVTTLLHDSGQWIRSFYPITPTKIVKNEKGDSVTIVAIDAQSLGSAITYARRYALASMVGVCPADDDGERAVGRDSIKKATPTTISKMQINELERLLEYRVDIRERLLDWAGINFIKDLPIEDYTKAIENVKSALDEDVKKDAKEGAKK